MTRYRIHFSILVSLVLTAVAWYSVKTSTEYYDVARFNRHVDELQSNIAFRMQTYINALVQTKSTFGITRVSREDFERYVQNLGLLKYYPGIQGLGYAVRIPSGSLEQHIDEIQRSGFPNYKVWPETPREEYFSIIYLEPFDWRNQRAFGYDMFTEPTRRAAMSAARDSGEPAASGKVTLVQETDVRRQPGFLIYVPVYMPGMPTGTVEQRRAALQGFVYSPFRAHDLFQAIFKTRGGTSPNIGFEVYDGTDATPRHLLYDDESQLAGVSHPHLQSRLHLEIAGRPWTVLISTLPGFELGWTHFAPMAVLGIGAAITLLLFTTLRANQKELAASAKTASLLREVESQSADLEIINQVGQSLAAQLDLDKLVQSITDAATRLAKAEFGALFYNVINQEGEAFLLYALSGAPREAFANVPPRNTAVFHPTFHGERIVRSADITKEDAYGKNLPFKGTPEGHLPVVSYLAVPVISRSGEVIGGLFFGHSQPGVFTEREEKLIAGIASQAAIAIDNAKLYQRAQDAIHIRDEFVSIASHEFRTPISTLTMQLQIFQRMLASKEGRPSVANGLTKGLDACERQVARLAALVEDLLDVTQIEAGRLSFRYQRTDLMELTQAVINNFTDSHETAVCTVQVGASGPLLVECDRLRIEQVILNLLTNAMKYGEGKPIRISVAASADGGSAMIRVSDSGMGIEKDNQARIFERFQRAISHKNISGLGLGLFISKQIIGEHGGRIEVDSNPGQGSTFTVYLPLIPETQAAESVL